MRIPLNGPAGLLIERLPRRRVLLAAQLIGVLSSLCYLLAGFWPLLIGRMLWGVSWVGLWIAGSAALLDVAPAESRGNLSGRFHLWIFAGFAGGSLVGGLLNDWLGYDGTFIVCALLGLLAWLLWLWKLPETSNQAQATPSLETAARPAEDTWRVRWLPLITAMLLMALNWMVYLGFISTTLTLLLMEKVGESMRVGSLLLPLTTLSGAAFAGKHVLSMVTSPLTGKISDRLGDRWRMIVFSLLLGSATLVVAAGAEGLLVIAGILPGAITNSILQTQSTALVGDLVPPRRRPRVLGLVHHRRRQRQRAGPAAGLCLHQQWLVDLQHLAAGCRPAGPDGALDRLDRLPRTTRASLRLNDSARRTRYNPHKIPCEDACASPET